MSILLFLRDVFVVCRGVLTGWLRFALKFFCKEIKRQKGIRANMQMMIVEPKNGETVAGSAVLVPMSRYEAFS